ncbi:uncharacterized protein LOC125227593 [Leguminivora glycinivorella]|uniref:uncharacterized protein LOC125227593 n=1 Tax=Leguminivora glycinivorella TaxID=1035111 RepID=UPI00200C9CB9|nr:uncharacterized protein LOC125227593 [Leguminivora glycinivorella]
MKYGVEVLRRRPVVCVAACGAGRRRPRPADAAVHGLCRPLCSRGFYTNSNIQVTDKHYKRGSGLLVELHAESPPPPPPRPRLPAAAAAMSPLACSLLALAALLAAADGKCATKDVGQKTKVPVAITPTKVNPPGATVTISNGCDPGSVIGETVRVCNNDDDTCTPTVDIADGQYSPVQVGCACQTACVLDGTQFC